MAFPIEIASANDEGGRPCVKGYGKLSEAVDGLCVSLSHKNRRAIAIVANTPVGIDIELIEDKTEGFYEMAFTDGERALLDNLPKPETAVRFWVAKEACSKKAGTGLGGAPRSFEVSAVDGDIVTIADERVQTVLLEGRYIAGWTI
jgi:phosphopantetheine--protein transferase-like protein